jgi:hypothetical protein
MAKSFLEAVEEAMPLHGRSPVTGRPKARPAKKEDEELDALAEAGYPVAAAAAPSPDGVSEKDKAELDEAESYGFTRPAGYLDDPDIPEVSYEELAGVRPEALAAMAGMEPVSEDRDELRSEAGSITSGEEPVLEQDMAAEMGPKFDKSALLDPTMGARKAGIPEEQLATLFKATHGGRFDPHSKTDRLKMKVIEDMLLEDGALRGLSPAKFAMKVYSRK